MRWIAILGVLAYRLFVRPFWRRRCLFDESCSVHAIRTFRTTGFLRGLPLVHARVRSCRMPASACFVLDAGGHAHLLTATGHHGAAPPPQALALLAHAAEQQAAGAIGTD